MITFLIEFLGALRGLAPVEGGSGKAEGFGAWVEISLFLFSIFTANSKIF